MKLLYAIPFPFFLFACGSDTPSFVEKPEGIITLSVSESAEESDDTIYAGDFEDEFSEAAEASEFASDDESAGDEEYAAGDTEATGSTPDSADATVETQVAASNTPDGDVPVDDKTVAKACAPHFKGLTQKIKVVDGDSTNLNLSVAPNTAIAFKVAGNKTKLNINLPAGNNLPGVCFFVTGNQAVVEFTTASSIQGLAYIGRGNQSSGTLRFTNGSPEQAFANLKGNGPSLKVQGMDAQLCEAANIPCIP